MKLVARNETVASDDDQQASLGALLSDERESVEPSRDIRRSCLVRRRHHVDVCPDDRGRMNS